jgi:ATP-dependent DNA helicase RecG
MTDTTDGFQIAERDLELRGPGDFFGTRQAGMPTFRLIDLVRDHHLLALAQGEAARCLEEAPPSPAALAKMLENWNTRFRLIEIG